MQDKGGRRNWNEYSLASSSSASGSGLHASTARQPAVSSAAAAPQQQAHSATPRLDTTPNAYSNANHRTTIVEPSRPTAAVPRSSTTSAAGVYAIRHARALYSFEPAGSGELAFERRGIIISYRSWARNIRMGGEGSWGWSSR